jgi:hypothetical protein
MVVADPSTASATGSNTAPSLPARVSALSSTGSVNPLVAGSTSRASLLGSASARKRRKFPVATTCSNSSSNCSGDGSARPEKR